MAGNQTLVERIVVGNKVHHHYNYDTKVREKAMPGDTIKVTPKVALAFKHKLMDPKVHEAVQTAEKVTKAAEKAAQEGVRTAKKEAIEAEKVNATNAPKKVEEVKPAVANTNTNTNTNKAPGPQ